MLPDVLIVVTTLAVLGAIGIGTRAGASRAGLDADAARSAWLRILLALGAMLGVAAIAAKSGVLARFEFRPPPLVVLVGSSFVLFGFMIRTDTFKRIANAMPLAWPIAIQSMRAPIELSLWALYSAGRLPVHLTFEGRNFDVLVGLTAPLVAVGISRGWIVRRALIGWHVVSLGLLANIVFMAVTSIPGPLHRPWPGVPNTEVAAWPFVWLPSFLVPVALFGHIVSLRQISIASKMSL